MVKIIEAKDLPEGNKIYLVKDYFGYRVVEPWKNPETNKINWFNLILGGKRGLWTLIGTLAIGAIITLGVNDIISAYKIIASHPCNFCSDCAATGIKTFGLP